MFTNINWVRYPSCKSPDDYTILIRNLGVVIVTLVVKIMSCLLYRVIDVCWLLSADTTDFFCD